MKKIAIITISFAIGFTACKKNKTTTSTAAVFTPSCNGTKSYASNVSPLIQSNCVSCHSQYSSYSGVKSASSSIRNVIVNGSMPKNGSLSDDQKNAIVCWIDAGAANN